MPAIDPIGPLKHEIARLLNARLSGWSQEMAAGFLGTDQPRVSDLRKYRLARFSLDRLVRFAARAGGDVSIQIVWNRSRFLGPRTGEGASPPGPSIPPVGSGPQAYGFVLSRRRRVPQAGGSAGNPALAAARRDGSVEASTARSPASPRRP
jgi:predicted XRE-type DNA-binding protein